MLTYEDVWDDLLAAMEDSGLEPFEVQNFIETSTCLREFRCYCQVPGASAGSEIRAEIAFVWDAVQTARSVYGHEAPPPSGFRMAPGFLSRDGAMADALELEIKYYFPAKDFESAGFLTRTVQNIIMGIVDHRNFPEVNFEISVAPDQVVHVHRAYAFYRWPVPLNTERLELAPLCREIARVLQALHHSGHFEESL
ncbi:hypothetical protein GTO89_00855 [Heliobacterium gestii]|uniref:Uncharacterized protein n=1 Tax=Heliomicrobium gestii TaxID=2699 RepID=A0A845L9I3_HELGE|nr:hypothetical protein [Heliomicrobium gestii]MBM7865319.1 hypothetical protein [Heliomicrobium gestii]MZP41580.1 hypothetical protein [Heliomicrobium gestii]